MKNLFRFFLGFSFLALIACNGCNSDPQMDIKAAQRAMEKAKDFHAEELAASDWKEAMQAWDEAQAVFTKGKSSRAYFRKAKASFDKATAVAEVNGTAMVKEIGNIQKTINERYMQIKATLANGRVKPKIQKELKPMLVEVAVDSSEVKDLIMHGDYPKAKLKVLDIENKMLLVESVMAGKKPALEK
jgi:hypothetical protein